MTTRTLIKQLSGNQYVEGVFAVYNCQLGQTKNGKPFLKCLLGDRSGRTPARMWNCTEELFNGLPTDGFVFIEGQSQPYQGEMQIIIQAIKAVDPSDSDLMDLLPSTSRDTAEMFSELQAYVKAVRHGGIRCLLEEYLKDEELMERFCRAPAAMSLHHAYIGGLLEHTLGLLRLADVICPCYPQLNRDIVFAGLFLHDIGKCAELSWDKGFNYTDDGQLVGHIARGVIWLQRKADDCAAMGQRLPEPVLRVLHHIILSHHGRPEFGALKIPATPEAIAVSLIDNMDAKLHMAIMATRGEVAGEGCSDPVTPNGKPAELGGNFTEKIWALETRLYRPDPTTVQE